MIGREDEVREYRDRATRFNWAVLAALFLLLTRLFFLQILKGEELRRFSEANRLKKEKLFPTRGILYDRNGKVIVDNRAAFDVVMLAQYYKFTPEMNAKLAKALGIPQTQLEKRLAKVSRSPSFIPILLKADVNKDVIAAIEMEAEGFPGVDIEANAQRRYPLGDAGAQLLGYTGEVNKREVERLKSKGIEQGDYIGRMGIERSFDPYLRGENGIGYVEVDAMGRRRKAETNERLLGFVSQTDPTPGDNLYLTLDADLQAVAGESMRSRDFTGSVIALDPRTGEVLAMVSFPTYKPSEIAGREVDAKIWKELRENDEKPLRNRGVQDHYPPGSTFKPFMTIAGLAEGKITPKSQVTCHGGMQFGSRRFNCWKRHGIVDTVRSIRESCDVFYYTLSNQLGIDTIAKWARLFGLGSPTHIGLESEARGLIPDSDWKLKRFKDIWRPGETLSVSIGQGYVDVTPIQLVAAYAAIGNGGFLYKPYIVRRIERRTGETVKEFEPELVRKIDAPKEVFDTVKEGLFEVANAPGGTAHYSGRSVYTYISGKTGTAQVRAFEDMMKVKCDALPRKFRHHGWFVGYAPRDNPELAVVALAEHSCHGTAAAPVVRDVIEAYLKKQALLAGRELEPLKDQLKVVQAAKKVKEEQEESIPLPPVDMPEAPRAAGERPTAAPQAPAEEEEAPEPPGEVE